MNSKKFKIPRLELLKISEFSPITNPYRTCKSSSRAYKEKNVVVRDSIAADFNFEENDENTLKKFSCIVKEFIKTIKATSNGFENYENKILSIQRLVENFRFSFSKFESHKFCFASDEKLKEELENCKKVAFMYEKKLKIKNETIFDLRKKVKEHDRQESCLKGLLNKLSQIQEKMFDTVNKTIETKFEQFNNRVSLFKDVIRYKLNENIEELKHFVQISNKNDFFNQRIEIYENKAEELELLNKEFLLKIQCLEEENMNLMNNNLSAENIINDLKEKIVDTKSLVLEFENITNMNENLQKFVKIKDFELKQIEFEKNELCDDKSELLNRIEALEIEIIEDRESHQKLIMKYSHQIEELVFLNAINKNKIAKLEKELLKFENIENSEKKNSENNDLLKETSEKDSKSKIFNEKLEKNESFEKNFENFRKLSETYQEAIKNYKQEIQNFQKEVQTHKENIETLIKSLKNTEEKIEKLVETNLLLEKSLKILKEENYVIKSTEKSSLIKVQSLEEEIKSLELNLFKVTDENSYLQDRLLNFSICKDDKNGEINSLQKENIRLIKDLIELKKNYEAIIVENNLLESKTNSVDLAITEFYREIEKMTQEQSKVTNNNENKELLQNINDLHKEVMKLQETNSELRKKMKNYEILDFTKEKSQENPLTFLKSQQTLTVESVFSTKILQNLTKTQKIKLKVCYQTSLIIRPQNKLHKKLYLLQESPKKSKKDQEANPINDKSYNSII